MNAEKETETETKISSGSSKSLTSPTITNLFSEWSRLKNKELCEDHIRTALFIIEHLSNHCDFEKLRWFFKDIGTEICCVLYGHESFLTALIKLRHHEKEYGYVLILLKVSDYFIVR